MKPQPVVLKATSKRGKAFKESMKTQGLVLPDIERYLMSVEEEERSTTVLHPSEITKNGWCPRATNYQILGTPRETDVEDVSPHLRRIFDEGDAIHEKYQKWMWRTGNLVGNYKCLRCEALFWARSPETCWVCGAPRWAMKYAEVPVISERYGIAGSGDGLYVSDDDEVLVEIKSFSEGSVRVLAPELYEHVESGDWSLNDMWKEFRRPFTAHLRQAVVYAIVLGVAKVSMIYECKWNQSWREFVIEPDIWMVHSILAWCESIVAARNEGGVVERPSWGDPEHKTCKSCPYRRACWERGS